MARPMLLVDRVTGRCDRQVECSWSSARLVGLDARHHFLDSQVQTLPDSCAAARATDAVVQRSGAWRYATCKRRVCPVKPDARIIAAVDQSSRKVRREFCRREQVGPQVHVLASGVVPTVRAVPGVLRRDGRQHAVDDRVADDRARSRRQHDRPAVGHGRLLAHFRKPAADGWIGRRPPRPTPRPAGGACAVRAAQSARHRRQLHGAADRAPRGTRRGCRDDGPDHQFARVPPVRRRALECRR